MTEVTQRKVIYCNYCFTVNAFTCIACSFVVYLGTNSDLDDKVTVSGRRQRQVLANTELAIAK